MRGRSQRFRLDGRSHQRCTAPTPVVAVDEHTVTDLEPLEQPVLLPRPGAHAPVGLRTCPDWFADTMEAIPRSKYTGRYSPGRPSGSGNKGAALPSIDLVVDRLKPVRVLWNPLSYRCWTGSTRSTTPVVRHVGRLAGETHQGFDSQSFFGSSGSSLDAETRAARLLRRPVCGWREGR